jgi:hypothetical protein
LKDIYTKFRIFKFKGIIAKRATIQNDRVKFSQKNNISLVQLQ